MTDNSKRTGAAVEAHYQFLLWLIPTIDRLGSFVGWAHQGVTPVFAGYVAPAQC
jgi:hypothetical protein